MKGLKILPILAIGLLTTAVSCTHKSEDPRERDANDLFSEQRSCTLAFIKNIKQAKDSAALDSIFYMYRDSIDRINFRHQSDADLHLSQGENDTLDALIRKLVEVYQYKRSKLLSTPADSAAQAGSASVNGETR